MILFDKLQVKPVPSGSELIWATFPFSMTIENLMEKKENMNFMSNDVDYRFFYHHSQKLQTKTAVFFLPFTYTR